MLNELLPCPFCGGETARPRKDDGEPRMLCMWFITCHSPNCGGEVGGFLTEAEAKLAWNRRAKSAAGGAEAVACCGDWDSLVEAPECKECPHRQHYLRARPSVAGMPDEPMATVLAEVEKAVAKFPTWPTDAIHAYAVLNEECGELDKAVLQHTYEPHKATLDDVRTEAIQTAAMAIRFLQSLDVYTFDKCEQHKQQAVRALGGA